ncbi:hypothetical protein COY32_02010 [candidate division WWE3 bacterium CG_4_10_14_0_2_um_filter_41_14]|uniref:Glycosyltransferase RgtA/B/C/D-like domain-containing protein n=1 Tax=candidate division WWE3 bacterium CG_4_10_14_0_2_um_filter_41_14 TaxID=1975072 RepID=A0A2M7TKF3_UNCKA|nr:MAG: hypothetical protein COY32_02010 [candidate division WWE3 bacterium CG_4_10_14_0_2_um_filter_41_14]
MQLTKLQQTALILLVIIFVYLFFSFSLYRWIIDDAGITFAYSQSLAHGFGIVAQAGSPPVEGYSNFLWMIFQVPFIFLNIFDPVVTPKIIAGVLFIGLLVLLLSLFDKKPFGQRIVIFTGLWIAMNPSLLIWFNSGLENSLYGLLFVSLIVTVYKKRDVVTPTSMILFGLIVSLLALTRPDGVIYAIIPPIFLVTHSFLLKKPTGILPVLRKLTWYVISIAIFYGGYVLFRMVYFHDVLPNTYHVKGGPSFDAVISLISLDEYVISKAIVFLTYMFGRVEILIAAIFIMSVFFVYMLFRKRYFPIVIVELLFFGLSFVTFLLMPDDWMPQFRFATPAIISGYLLFFTTLYYSREILAYYNKRAKKIVTVFAILISIAAMKSFSETLSVFAKSPTAPFSYVSRIYGHKFNAYADSLGVTNGSIVTPDVGGVLYYSNLRVIDLAGLTDKRIAQSFNSNPADVMNYIFDEVKPTFIHTHGWFAYVLRFDEDERFTSNYVLVDVFEDRYIAENFSLTVYTGEFVRKDVVKDIPNYQQLWKDLQYYDTAY